MADVASYRFADSGNRGEEHREVEGKRQKDPGDESANENLRESFLTPRCQPAGAMFSRYSLVDDLELEFSFHLLL